jgi:methionine salvage enolase-phosphatase E1
MGDILFLDDIGGNLKAAKQFGMRTIKVNLGRTNEAVRELEQAVEMTLIEKDAGSSRL